jgi:hypothetical protein
MVVFDIKILILKPFRDEKCDHTLQAGYRVSQPKRETQYVSKGVDKKKAFVVHQCEKLLCPDNQRIMKTLR